MTTSTQNPPIHISASARRILSIEQVSNGFVLRDATAAYTAAYVERSVEQLLDRIREILGEPFAPQDGG